MAEARLEHITHGLAPVTDGWFVVNAADAQWINHPDFGWQCPFEANGPVVRQRDDLEPTRFPQVGINLSVLEQGKPKGLYHREGQQEDFLVLRGECLLIVEGEERPLKQWDFFHSPFYPRNDAAIRHGAAAQAETDSGAEAYAPHGHWQPGERPPGLG